MTPSITRRLEFDAGHRLVGHEGKCRNVHGHRYVVEVTCEALALDAVGRVIDFGAVKEKFGGWLDDQLDHGFLVGPHDPIRQWLHDNDMKTYAMSEPPTAENLATMLLRVARERLASSGLSVRCLRVYETPNCWADAS